MILKPNGQVDLLYEFMQFLKETAVGETQEARFHRNGSAAFRPKFFFTQAENAFPNIQTYYANIIVPGYWIITGNDINCRVFTSQSSMNKYLMDQFSYNAGFLEHNKQRRIKDPMGNSYEIKTTISREEWFNGKV